MPRCPHRAAPLQADIHTDGADGRRHHLRGQPLPLLTRAAILAGMFSISDKDIAAIQAAFERGGELSATVEVRRLFPGIPDNAEARRIALIIAGWEPANPREP